MTDPGYSERQYRSQDNLRLYWRDYGDPASPRTTVLCLPGLTRNSKDFHKVALALAPERRVICPDYRGRGRSHHDPDWRRYQPTTYLNDIRHLLVVAGVHRVAVIGTSMGGLLATGLAAVAPTAIAGVLLNDVGPDLNPDGIKRIFNYVGRDWPQPDWATAVEHLKTILPRIGLDNEEDWMTLTRNTFREGDDGLLHVDWDIRLALPFRKPPARPPDLWALLRGLEGLPVAAIRGENSDVLGPETFEHMGDALPDLYRVTVPGRGHTPTLREAPSVEAIGWLLDRV